ncbi:hypothetical protein [Thermococcus stetteri]|uniref:hypothetical protein n=1 Tax=Thermococcus stetteri TaxID=49900 RepID=UPI001AEAA214|nr:hypothetical protein [Thermococcus stetteri]MBP1911676.1 hypothetical protein [Thermococcus stetteri]
MPFGCREKGKELKREEVEGDTRELLSKAEKVWREKKILLLYHGEKIGKLKEDVPLEEVEIERVWRSPLGIKVELSWHGRFVGSLILKEE